MRKETKIGFFVVLTIALAIWGFQYLRGFNVLANNTVLYAVYNDVDGLQISSPIKINGLQAGLVSGFEQVDGDLNRIKVTLSLNKGIKVPKTTTAEVVGSLMGSGEIRLAFEGSCEGADCAQNGDVIAGVNKSMLASFTSPEEVATYMAEITKGLNTVIDTLNYKLSQSDELNKSVDDVKVILANLRSTTGKLDRVMDGSSSAIEGSLKNVESITANLKENNAKISTILANAEKLSNDLKEINLSELSGETKKTMQKLQNTLATSDKAINDLGALLKNMNKEGEGAVAMLLHDKEFAAKLQSSIKNFELLLEDLRLHPERYRRILSKKKMPYEAPAGNN